jgi:hypothetical protein
VPNRHMHPDVVIDSAHCLPSMSDAFSSNFGLLNSSHNRITMPTSPKTTISTPTVVIKLDCLNRATLSSGW